MFGLSSDGVTVMVRFVDLFDVKNILSEIVSCFDEVLISLSSNYFLLSKTYSA